MDACFMGASSVPCDFDPASRLKQLRRDRVERIQHLDHEAAGGGGLLRGGFAGQTEVGQCRGRGAQRVGVHRQEGADHRRGGAPGAGHAPHQRVAVKHARDPAAVGRKIHRAGDGEHGLQLPGQGLGDICGLVDRVQGVDPPGAGVRVAQRQDLGGVAADDPRPGFRDDPPGGLGPERGGTGAHRVQDDRGVERGGFAAGLEHGVDPLLAEGADVQHQRRREGDHVLDLVRRMGHHRGRPHGEQRVGGVVHHDEIGDVVDERFLFAHGRQVARGRLGNSGHGLPPK